MLATLGDLVEDIVVELGGPIRPRSDTEASIHRRRGGSAANVAAAAAELGRPVRLLAQVGDDPIGRTLIHELAGAGVDVSEVRSAGSTGAIVVLVDRAGERTMLTDRRAAVALAGPDPRWLDGVDALHVPLYSLAGGEIARTARATIEEAHRRRIPVSVDLSSVAVIDDLGGTGVRELVGALMPAIVFANEDEAAAIDAPIPETVTVVKRGPRAAVVHRPGAGAVEVPAVPLAQVADTTGAGDHFAAGFLTTSGWTDDPVRACVAGHRVAAAMLARRPLD